ncbi:uncharacterized protein LOC131023299 [Salvia miltiorrhiza]|uniref:uncharacterized protein LOC131023299 n=1 Tax=Salvia miltiorrhiza TaxID=226208 RepID=UPI0025AC25B9|nr:uncharacterized protein LOC131023299 [Salvia miltiorrhiza]
MKRSLEATYRERHRLALREEVPLLRKEALRIDERRSCMMKYWVMAATSNPEFVMARSVVCTTSALLCLIALITLPIAYVFVWKRHEGPSVYKASVEWILYTQTVGVAVATIAPVSRWFVVVSFKYSNMNRLRDEMKMEKYWVQTLVDLRESFSGLQIGQVKCLHDLKWFVITFCIGIQILIVLLSKLFVFLSALLMTPCFYFCEQLYSIESDNDKGLNLSRYVLLLQGEAELPRTAVKNICSEADRIIQTGKGKQPKSLINLVSKSVDLKGLGLFDSNQVPSLHSQEPPNCWSLPVVTLTSIALAIPHAAEKKKEGLLNSVREGLSLAKLVEKTLVKDERRVINIREATDMCWVGVVLYMKWLDIDLKRMSLDCRNSKEMLRELSEKAERIVAEYLERPFVEDPLDWPARVIAANSMYRISRSVVLCVDDDDDDEGVLEKLCVMIADIMAACFTNLPNVITVMCQGSAIEKREKSVEKAFVLLGKTEEIVEAVQRLEWPPMDHEKAAEIEEWQAWFRQTEKVVENLVSVSVSTTDETQHLVIQVDTPFIL